MRGRRGRVMMMRMMRNASLSVCSSCVRAGTGHPPPRSCPPPPFFTPPPLCTRSDGTGRVGTGTRAS
eukprot:2847568-Pyramimonas_sp.AAC.2